MADEVITIADLPLAQGAKNDAAKALQRLLNLHRQDERAISEDGDFGRGTALAVRVFQARRNLPIDGIVDYFTLVKLRCPPQCEEPDETFGGVATGAGQDAPWMRYALAEFGIREQRGSRHNSRIVEYHRTTTLPESYASKDETAWCASFVNWCMEQAGYTGTDSAGAASWFRWGDSLATPKFGAVMGIHNPEAKNTSLSTTGDHVGFHYQSSSTHFILLGGNQGNRVKVSRFPKSKWTLKGTRWPDASSAPAPAKEKKIGFLDSIGIPGLPVRTR